MKTIRGAFRIERSEGPLTNLLCRSQYICIAFSFVYPKMAEPKAELARNHIKHPQLLLGSPKGGGGVVRLGNRGRESEREQSTFPRIDNDIS